MMKVEDVANFAVTDVYWGHMVDTQKERVGVWYMQQAPNWCLCFKYEGMTCYDFNGKRKISDATSVVLIPPGMHYSYNCCAPGRLVSLYFNIKENPNIKPEIIFLSIRDKEKVFYKFRRVHEALENGASNVEVFSYFYDLLFLILREGMKKPVPEKKTSTQQKVEPAEVFIRTHFTEAISNEELAKLCGFSTQYFRKVFTEVYGVPPMSYLQKARLEEAVRLLKTGTSMPIAEVASKVGFSDVYHFSKTFKKYTGVPPRRFATQHKMEK